MFPVPVTVPAVIAMLLLAVILAATFQLPPVPLKVRSLKVSVEVAVMLLPEVVAFRRTVVLAALKVASEPATKRPPTVSVVVEYALKVAPFPMLSVPS